MIAFADCRWNRGTTTSPSPGELDAIARLLAPAFVVARDQPTSGLRVCLGNLVRANPRARACHCPAQCHGFVKPSDDRIEQHTRTGLSSLARIP
jgi:hypothetical protein